jgi:SAM-dependent methyltransferase
MTKIRDSGMPAVAQWESYFDADSIVESLFGALPGGDAVEFGCGYGTFTAALGRRMSGRLHALDIDPLMVGATRDRVSGLDLTNVRVEQRDFVAHGCGCEARSIDRVLLFNILHLEDPVALLEEAYRVLRQGGCVGVIHWRHDPGTPRGPPLDIRPRPHQCRQWGEAAGLHWVRDARWPGSPWHWGMVLHKP